MSPPGKRLLRMTKRREIWDAIILGSGFAGGLLGWILAKQGWRVMIVDPGRHPRFAVGESSTPTADFLLSHLADRWGLQELAPLATWGSWKASYPELVCGKKRSFSYYRHFSKRPFRPRPTAETPGGHGNLPAGRLAGHSRQVVPFTSRGSPGFPNAPRCRLACRRCCRVRSSGAGAANGFALLASPVPPGNPIA